MRALLPIVILLSALFAMQVASADGTDAPSAGADAFRPEDGGVIKQPSGPAAASAPSATAPKAAVGTAVGQKPRAKVQPAEVGSDASDPDSSPEMKLLWDMWNKRVGSAIYDRYKFYAQAAFKYSRPLRAEVHYVVTRDHHIVDLELAKKSPNILYNVVVCEVVKSLDGNASVLAFPAGSKRQFMIKVGTFTQNETHSDFRAYHIDALPTETEDWQTRERLFRSYSAERQNSEHETVKARKDGQSD